jgi:DivIVA domain-containing protein
MPFQPEDIASKQFLVRGRGYDRDEVGAFLRAVAADYEEALRAATEVRLPTDAGDTERRAVELLDAASRRLQEVARRERCVVAAELRVANQLRVIREALEHARVTMGHTVVVDEGEAVPA